MINHTEKLAELKSTIAEKANPKACISIAGVLNCIGIPLEDSLKSILNQMQEGKDASENLTSIIQARVAKDIFILENQEQVNSELLMKFEEYEALTYDQISWLIKGYEANLKSVEDNFSDLKNKRLRIQDDDAWNKALAEFAASNFMMVRMTQAIIDLSPREIYYHFSKQGLNDVPGRFASQAFLLTQASKSEDATAPFEGDGHDYEYHIASIISKHLPAADVFVTKGSGDQGADIIVTIGTAKIVVQTKLYSSAVGNGAVQEVYAAKRHYQATAAVVVTNATFTKSAHQLAESLDVALLHEDDVGPVFFRAFS